MKALILKILYVNVLRHTEAQKSEYFFSLNNLNNADTYLIYFNGVCKRV